MKPKIFLIRNVAPENFGGGETYQIELSKVLLKNDLSPIIVTASRQLLEESKKNNIQAIRSPYLHWQNWSGWRNVLLPTYFIWQIRLYIWYKKLFQKHHPKAVDIQSRDDWIAATLAAKKMHIKVLWTDHIDFRTWVLTNINQRFKNPIGKYILKLASIPKKIITISDTEKHLLESIIAPRKLDNLCVIKNGSIDQYEKYKDVVPHKQTFCYVGRIVKYKGITDLIKAFDSVQVKYKHAQLNIYGDGPDLPICQELAKNNSQIIFYGHTDQPLDAISKSETFVLPSHREGLSLSLLDAAMLKKTIIATDTGSSSEVVVDGKTGILIQSQKYHDLAGAMNKVLNDRALSCRMASNARELYERDFNFTNNVENFFIPLL